MLSKLKLKVHQGDLYGIKDIYYLDVVNEVTHHTIKCFIRLELFFVIDINFLMKKNQSTHIDCLGIVFMVHSLYYGVYKPIRSHL